MHGKETEGDWATFEAGIKLVRDGLDETRRLISGLRPPILDEFGIVAALDYLVCDKYGRDETEVRFTHDVQFERLAPPLESAVFRIVQESLTNARRHSNSELVHIQLEQRDKRLIVGIRDWGRGFDPEEIEDSRFGLRGIRERARLLGGQATIESTPGRGTHVVVDLPLVAPTAGRVDDTQST